MANELTVPQIDFSSLGNLGQVYQQAQARRTLADLGTQLSNGTIDYQQAAGKLAQTGNLNGTLQLLALGQKQKENAAAGQAIQTAFGYGGVQPSASPNSGAVVPNDSNAIPGTVGMNQRLADLSSDFMQDNPGTSLSSGVRSTVDQARLYADRGNNPNPVAPPGSSNHERGLAVDIGGMTPEQRAMLPQYGLAQPVANDPPHVELAAGTDAPPAGGGEGLSREQLSALAANPTTRPLAMAILKDKLTGNRFTQETDADGNIWNINKTTGQKVIALKASDKTEKNGGLMGVGAGGAVFDPKTKQVVFKNDTGGGLDDKTLNFMADQYLAGDKTVLQNIGRGAQGAADIRSLRQKIAERGTAQGLDGPAAAQRMIDYVGDTARERTAGTQEGRMVTAGIEANGAIELGRAASAAVPRTNWVPVNRAIQAYQNNTSDPKLRAFGAANLTIINTYARAINPTGVGTMHDKEEASKMLATADGPAAYEAVLQQLQKEIELAHTSPGKARAGFSQQRANRFS